MNISGVKQFFARRSPPNRPILGALLLAAFAVAVFAGSALAAGNLVKNGSFEKDSDGDGIPNKWVAGVFGLTLADKRVCNQSKAGSCSFKIVADGTIKQLTQEIVAGGLADNQYNLSAWTKGKTIVYGAGTAQVLVRFNHTDGSNNGWAFEIPAGTSPWTLRQFSPAVAFENFDSITIILEISADSGKLWVDKVKLVEAP